jgi:predicted RecA/RadA family phage recombinase
MGTAEHVQPGNTATVTLAASASIGDVLVYGGGICVVLEAGESGDEVEVSLTGVYELPKASGALTQGAEVGWDTSETEVVAAAASGANAYAGIVHKDAASGDTHVQVKIDQAAPGTVTES